MGQTQTRYPLFNSDATEHARKWFEKRGHKEPFCQQCGGTAVNWTYDVCGWLAGRCVKCGWDAI